MVVLDTAEAIPGEGAEAVIEKPVAGKIKRQSLEQEVEVGKGEEK